MSAAVLLDGPRLDAGPESLDAHYRRLGPLPAVAPAELIHRVEASGLTGRGGAGFPVARKWRSVAERAAGRAVLVVNGAEGEPLSLKDRTLMATRPHLVLDGAELAARAVGARDIILYVGGEHRAALAAMSRAVAERAPGRRGRLRLVEAPAGYVAGEETATIHWIESGIAAPTTTPPRPYERGVGGRPTLVQNVESLAAVALLGRGVDGARTRLLTLSGGIRRPGLVEIERGARIRDAAQAAGGLTAHAQAVLLGGYFGAWAGLEDAWDSTFEAQDLRPRGLTAGCGVVSVLPVDACGVEATAKIMAFMAGQSARQCGPCVFGLGAIAAAVGRLAGMTAQPGDLERAARWSDQLSGRGACRHPDGAVIHLRSALRVFGDEFAAHQHRHAHQTVAQRVAGAQRLVMAGAA